MTLSIVLEPSAYVHRDYLAQAETCAQQCHLPLSNTPEPSADYALLFGEQGVRLRHLHSKQADLQVDFTSGSTAHRRKFGGGKGQMIAKAVGVKAGIKPHVHDMTAGLGGDAFVLASLGCPVTMVERHPVVYALLRDGLQRAVEYAQAQDEELLEILARMTLIQADARQWLQAVPGRLSVVYLDPMFPERKKSASVKKEMQIFHQLVGQDADEADLLQAALEKAEHRVVVKRPRIAPVIAGPAPSYRLEGKSSRYDIYAFKALSKD